MSWMKNENLYIHEIIQKQFSIGLFALCMIFLVCLAGCGKKQGGEEKEDHGTSAEEVSYEASYQETISIQDSVMGFFCSCLYGDAIYYFDEQDGKKAIYCKESAEKEARVLFYCEQETDGVFGLCVSKDESLNVLVHQTAASDQQGSVSLKQYERNGTLLKSTVISGVPEGCLLQDITCTADGNLYVLVKSHDGKAKLMALPSNGSMKEVQAAIPQNISGLAGINNKKSILLFDQNDLYEFDGRECRKLFQWIDVSVSGQNVRAVWKDDEQVRVFLTDLAGINAEVAVIYERNGEENAEPKQTLTLATLNASTPLKNTVTNYNRSQNQYHIEIKEYLQIKGNEGRKDMEDAVTRMCLDLLGNDAPDMLDLSPIINYRNGNTVSVEDLLEKDYVMDLTPFVEGSETIDLSDYEEKVLELCSYQGRYAAIPFEYNITTLIANDEVVNMKDWTISDFISLDNLQEEHLINGLDRWTLLDLCVAPNLDYFVDERSGKCHFKDPEFQMIMEKAVQLPDHNGDIVSLMQFKERKSVYQSQLMNLDSWFNQLFNCYGEHAVLIGYPGVEPGQSSNKITIAYDSSALAICSSCKNPQAAWDFIETYLNVRFFAAGENKRAYAARNYEDFGIPANKKVLEELISYLMEDGGGMGNVIESELLAQYKAEYPDVYVSQPLKPEEVELFRDCLKRAKTMSAKDDIYMSIIKEECGAYFAGQKSLDDVIDIMQNRIELYLAESK